MKKKNILVLSLLALFTLGACGEAGEGAQGPQGPQGEAGAPGQPGQQGEQGLPGQAGQSAYEIYKQSHPEYTGDEAQWISDLVNGRLADKEGEHPIEYIELDYLSMEEVEEVYPKISYDFSHVSYILQEGYFGDPNYAGMYEEIVEGDITANDVYIGTYEENEYDYIDHFVVTDYHVKYDEKYVIAQNDTQLYSYSVATEVKGNTSTKVGDKYCSFDNLYGAESAQEVAYQRMSSYAYYGEFYKTKDGHLYSFYQSFYMDTFTALDGNSYPTRYYVSVVMDFNTVENPKLLSYHYMERTESDVDPLVRQSENYVLGYCSVDAEFEYGTKIAAVDKDAVYATTMKFFIDRDTTPYMVVRRDSLSYDPATGNITGHGGGSTGNYTTHSYAKASFSIDSVTVSCSLVLSDQSISIDAAKMYILELTQDTYGYYSYQTRTIELTQEQITVQYPDDFVAKEYASATYHVQGQWQEVALDVVGTFTGSYNELNVFVPALSVTITHSSYNLFI